MTYRDEFWVDTLMWLCWFSLVFFHLMIVNLICDCFLFAVFSSTYFSFFNLIYKSFIFIVKVNLWNPYSYKRMVGNFLNTSREILFFLWLWKMLWSKPTLGGKIFVTLNFQVKLREIRACGWGRNWRRNH